MPGHAHASRPRTAATPGRRRPGRALAPAPEAGSATVGEAWLRRAIDVAGRGPGLEPLLPAIAGLLAEAAGSDGCDVRPSGDDPGAPLPAPRDDAATTLELRTREGDLVGEAHLRTDPPRDLDPDALGLAAQLASLVADAVANARRYDEERARVRTADRLTALTARLGAAAGRGELARVACDGALELLGADRCALQVAEGDDVPGHVVAQAGDGDDVPPFGAAGRSVLAAPVGDGGVLSVERAAPFLPGDRPLLEAFAAQVAVALRTAGDIERLTEEHLVRELFDAIAAGRGVQAAARLRSARVDAEAPHVVVVLEPRHDADAWTASERLERRLRRVAPGALCDPGPERLRALLPVPLGETREAGLRALDAELDALAREEGVVAGRSRVQPQLAAEPASLVEAAAAARIARALAPGGGARAWEQLGAYRYLVGVGGEVEPDARHARAIDALWTYDARRGSELVATLERYLADRSVVPTARALQIHANTLRQRLERIEHLTELVIAEEDLVSLELALKLHRLRAPERDRAA